MTSITQCDRELKWVEMWSMEESGPIIMILIYLMIAELHSTLYRWCAMLFLTDSSCVCVRDAWSCLGEMSSENAMAAYVDEMKKVAQEVYDRFISFRYFNETVWVLIFMAWLHLHTTDGEKKYIYILMNVPNKSMNIFDVNNISWNLSWIFPPWLSVRAQKARIWPQGTFSY